MSDSVDPKKVGAKMVPEGIVIGLRKDNDALKKSKAAAEAEVNALKSKVKMLEADLTDDGQEAIRSYLIDRDKELNDRETEVRTKEDTLQERESSITEREKEGKVTALAAEYGVEVDAIKDADDPEKEALKLSRESLIKGKEEKPKNPAEETFDVGGAGGQLKKSIKDITTKEELDVVEAELKAKAAASA